MHNVIRVFPIQDFGNIFSSLLPDASSKLSPPEGMTELDGLEIKVGFGGVWKESLTELSGGQRSDTSISYVSVHACPCILL